MSNSIDYVGLKKRLAFCLPNFHVLHIFRFYATEQRRKNAKNGFSMLKSPKFNHYYRDITKNFFFQKCQGSPLGKFHLLACKVGCVHIFRDISRFSKATEFWIGSIDSEFQVESESTLLV